MNGVKDVAFDVAKKEVKKRVWTWIITSLVSALPIILPIFTFLVVLFAIIGIFDEEESSRNVGYGNTGSFNISSTILSSDEFSERLYEASLNNPSLRIFSEHADDIYDSASSMGINPELVVLRAIVEGFSPGVGYNYWGINCSNTGGGSDCQSFNSFNLGVNAFLSIVSRYSSLEEWMSAYSYIGEYWWSIQYTSAGQINWGIGGCAYASHIYSEDNMPSYVSDACSSSAPFCGINNTSNCTPTTAGDQEAYAKWQVMEMAQLRKDIFGIELTDYGSGFASDQIIMLSDAEAWNLLTGYSSRDEANNVSESSMNSRMTTIEVPIRVWSSNDSSDYSTKKINKKITVNVALANLYYNFFNDVYNEATDFVFVPGQLYCYSYRNATNGTRLSAHAYGAACDINPTTDGNGYGDHIYTNAEWENIRKSKSKYQIIYKDSKIVEIIHRYTLSWGGEWRSVRDAMHISFIGDESRASLQNRG